MRGDPLNNTPLITISCERLVAATLALLMFGHVAEAATALVADRLIDGRSDSPRTPGVVLVEGDRIVAVGDR